MVAEESTAWPLVTRPPYLGGLGFTFKWDMGWMHDTLNYFHRDPVYRKFHQNDLTFATLYRHNENFILPLSHDEIVHGKASLLHKMPGDDWRKFANLRCLLGYQWLFAGKKLLFMGGEFGQRREWDVNTELDWSLLDQGPHHKGLQRWVADLNRLYTREPALWEGDYAPGGFQWIDCADHEHSILSFMRRASDGGGEIVAMLNLTPITRHGYRVGLPRGGRWREELNSDASVYGGTNLGNGGGIEADDYQVHNQPFSGLFTLPPLGVLAFKPEG
jgi:1,4-alpha-glucan branching enzyme